MRTRKLRTAVGMLSWLLALWLAGCQSAQQVTPTDVTAAPQSADAMDEAQGVAEATFGKQAEILARGNLALNGQEQLLVVNRLTTGAPASKGGANPLPIFVTRAAILEKNDDKWSEILLCDEHLKNPNGYLGGSPAGRVTGWRLAYNQDTKEGLEMKFTPAERFDDSNVNSDQSSGQTYPTLDVRWNESAKRYQSFDQSHERYLSEVPSLETPQSILK
jgi:hypothetical protein